MAIVEGRRRNRVAELGRKVENLVESTGDLVNLVLESDQLEELISRAIEDAARTTWEEKLDALARVVAAAVDGDDTVVSTSLLVEAALSRLERPHVVALKCIAQAGSATRQQLAEGWPGSVAILDALLSVLAGEGLIRNIAPGTYDGVGGRESWVLSELGEELLLLLDPKNAGTYAPGEIAVRVANTRSPSSTPATPSCASTK